MTVVGFPQWRGVSNSSDWRYIRLSPPPYFRTWPCTVVLICFVEKHTPHSLVKYGIETICFVCHYPYMPWTVLFHTDFLPEFEKLSENIQDELMARVGLLENAGPDLGRPTVDVLTSSSFSNMKE